MTPEESEFILLVLETLNKELNMSSRSAVTIIVKSDKIEAFKNYFTSDFIYGSDFLSDADDVQVQDSGTLWYFEEIKWSMCDDSICNLYDFLRTSIGYDNYQVREYCYDYPESDDGESGNWNDNPFHVGRMGGLGYTSFN